MFMTFYVIEEVLSGQYCWNIVNGIFVFAFLEK